MILQARARIIVEKHGNQWSAWFADTPQQAAGGEFPSDAIWRLLELFASEMDFDTDQTASIDSATTDDHLEFSIPYRHARRFPNPSLN